MCAFNEIVSLYACMQFAFLVDEQQIQRRLHFSLSRSHYYEESCSTVHVLVISDIIKYVVPQADTQAKVGVKPSNASAIKLLSLQVPAAVSMDLFQKEV